MSKNLFLIGLIMIIGISTNYAYSQEIGLATFQESAQLIIDKKMSQNSITSITLLSTNTQEIKIPIELEEKIRENKRIQAIVITNQNNCVLGVTDQSCILINVERNPEDKGINAIQNLQKKLEIRLLMKLIKFSIQMLNFFKFTSIHLIKQIKN